VPSNMAREVMEQVLEFGEVRRGQLGVTIQDLTPALAEALALDVRAGAIVTDVQAGSAAAQAGLVAGDVITAVNGEPVGSSTELRNEIGFTRPGENIEVTIVRNGQTQSVQAQVGEMQASSQARAGANNDPLAGAEIVDLEPGDPRRNEVQGGVLVARVQPGSNAAAMGLREQDLILAVNRTPIASVGELNQALGQAEGAVALTVLRGGQRLFLVLQ
jgi:serine protease DegQ